MSQNTSRTLRPRPRATEALNMKTSAREKRGAKTKSGNTRPKKAEMLERLRTPITKFQYKPPLTHPTWEEWLKERDEYGVKYRAGQEAKIGDVDWVSVEAYQLRDDSVLGFLLMPARYYPLWRRLLWGALWYETMWEIWEEEAKKTQKKQKKTKADKWVLIARRSAAMRAVWYRAFHCNILAEFLTLNVDAYTEGTPNHYLHWFLEFGVRDYRSWLFDSIDDLHEKDKLYLTLDPTAPKNVKIFERGALGPLITNPPLDDDWLGGEVPFPKPRAEFVADLLRYGPQGPVEALPCDSEEGLDHMDDNLRLWELVEPEFPFYSRNYIVFARSRGQGPAQHRREYLRWLLARSRDETVEGVDWFQETTSLSITYPDNQETKFDSLIEHLKAGEIEEDECLDFFLGDQGPLEEPDSGSDIVQARKELGEALGPDADDEEENANLDDDEQDDGEQDDDEQDEDSDGSSPMSISSV